MIYKMHGPEVGRELCKWLWAPAAGNAKGGQPQFRNYLHYF